MEILSNTGPSTPIVEQTEQLLPIIQGESTTPCEFLGYLSNLSLSDEDEEGNGVVEGEAHPTLPPQKRMCTALAIHHILAGWYITGVSLDKKPDTKNNLIRYTFWYITLHTSWLLSPLSTVPAWCQFKLSTPAIISRVHRVCAQGSSTFLGIQNPPLCPIWENPDLETLSKFGTARIEMQKPLFCDRRLQRGTNTLINQHTCYIALSIDPLLSSWSVIWIPSTAMSPLGWPQPRGVSCWHWVCCSLISVGVVSLRVSCSCGVHVRCLIVVGGWPDRAQSIQSSGCLTSCRRAHLVLMY